jgi:hypothetical protein
MKIKLFSSTNWLFTHRIQLQVALFVIVLSLTLIALFATGTIVRADQIVITPH